MLRFSAEAIRTPDSNAEAVFGQTDFTSTSSGTSATTLNNPIHCTVDFAGRLFVSDSANHRVLRYDTASNKSTGAAADGVLGQTNFTTVATIVPNAAHTANRFQTPLGLAIAPNGSLFVADQGSDRVLRFDNPGAKANGGNADGVLGVLNFTGNGTQLNTSNSTPQPRGLTVDSAGNLYVGDGRNGRVLRFSDAVNKANGANVDAQLGAPLGFNQAYPRKFPGDGTGLAVLPDGSLAVAALASIRVLIFNNAATFADNADADFVLGQPDFTSSFVNPTSPSASNTYFPASVAYNPLSGHLLVVDAGYRRVLGYTFNAPPAAVNVAISGTAAVGQTLTGSYTYSDTESDVQGVSTFTWYADTASTGNSKQMVSNATSQTYTPVVGDIGKFLFFCVTPVAQTGATVGMETCANLTTAVPANAAPTASNLSIAGTVALGQLLTGSYTYSDAENDAQGASTFKWYADTGSSGNTKQAISGATASTYTPVVGDVGKVLFFCVTPVAQTGTTAGTEICSGATTAVPTNSAPTAINVAIAGTANVGQQLSGSYTYSDNEIDVQDTSTSGTTFRFVRSTDNSVTTLSDNTNVGTGTTGGATKTYTPLANDLGAYVFYCVTPKAVTGTVTGTEVCSSATPAIAPGSYSVIGSSSPLAGGAVTCTPTTVPAGGNSTCSATPNPGFVFGEFSGDCTGSSCSLSNIQANKAVTATFFPNRMINSSIHGQVQGSSDQVIAGFAITGSSPKTLLIRGVKPPSPTTGASFVNSLNPGLRLFSGATEIANNDDWGSASNVVAVQATGLAPTNAQDAAILTLLAPGNYTAVLSGVGDSQGAGLVEMYELDHPESALTNISGRAKLWLDSGVIIGGFVVQGTAPRTYLIRAVGPNLANFGVQGAIANPVLTLFSGQTVIGGNDNWGTEANAPAIQATGLAPVNALESAILVTLQPGAYTVMVSDANGSRGTAILEVFAQ